MSEPSVRIERMSPRQEENAQVVWSVCRYCNDPIPASEKRYAFCDSHHKKALMREEMQP